MPSRDAVYNWRDSQPGFREAFQRAQEKRADSLVDEIPDIADNEPDPQRARNKMDARKWFAGVVKPREYGPRLDLQVTEKADIAGARDEARRRVRPRRDLAQQLVAQVIDGQTVYAPAATDSVSAAPSIFD